LTGAIWEYAAVFGASLLLAFGLTPLVLRVAQRRGILDHPGEHKGHTLPVPYLGGLAMVTALSAAVIAAALVRPPSSGLHQLEAVLGLAVALSLIGLLDDLRGLGPVIRLVAEIAAAAGVWIAGARVELSGNQPVDLVLTVVWVVGITNAFNLLDNMDGLSAGVATIASASFFGMAAVNDQYLVAGFLRHNFHPARIYMGDAGSLYLGFVLAYLGLKLRFESSTDVTFLVPILALGVPILDTTLVTISRLRRHRSPFQGGQDHLSHRLVRLGLPVPGAVGTIYAAAASLGVLAWVVSRIDRTSAYVLAGLVVALGALAILALLRVRVYEPDGSMGVPSATALP
jgi:UDP-GlcNAc:undecaprenyl-phosphate GlcNAc-1-phosphate transferase